MRRGEYPKGHPDHDQSEYYTTFWISNNLHIKRDRLRNWITRGDVVPLYQIEDSRGKKSYFAKAQLYYLRLFEYLVDMGVKRDWAKLAVNQFDGLRCSWQDEPDLAIFHRAIGFELKSGKKTKSIVRVELVRSNCKGVAPVDFSKDIDDAYVVNFRKIFNEINSLT
jgi:hypothetical protein